MNCAVPIPYPNGNGRRRTHEHDFLKVERYAHGADRGRFGRAAGAGDGELNGGGRRVRGRESGRRKFSLSNPKGGDGGGSVGASRERTKILEGAIWQSGR